MVKKLQSPLREPLLQKINANDENNNNTSIKEKNPTKNVVASSPFEEIGYSDITQRSQTFSSSQNGNSHASQTDNCKLSRSLSEVLSSQSMGITTRQPLRSMDNIVYQDKTNKIQ
eukprot:TRINITY_DN4760_c1_g1_i5.p2 TRINITY_DN4760_c1_g1~~TRINITY_DN4760_c1_g1_i5.p2  ORF type:complete len:115 (-),score=4.30 TRINITY_DN4760_c1_g1_i5:127-471(-)